MSRHESPVAYSQDGMEYFRLPPTLERDDPLFDAVRQRCAEGVYECGAPVCEDRRLKVTPTTQLAGGGWRAAFFSHISRREDGATTSPGESHAHQLAKHHMQELGRSMGHATETERTIGDRTAGTRRPDVIWTPNDGSAPWAVEVQFSTLQAWEWRDRTKDLRNLGYRPLWLWGVETRAPLGRYDNASRLSQMYQRPADVWVVEVAGVAALDVRAAVAQCHSVGFHWERLRHGADRRPPWPNALDYDPRLGVEYSNETGLRCPDIDRDLAAIEAGRTVTPSPLAWMRDLAEAGSDNRLLTRASVLAAVKLRRQALAGQVSTRGELCQSCGDPLYACPGTVRVFVRCCPLCTHLTNVDLDYFAQHPDYAESAFPHRLNRGAA